MTIADRLFATLVLMVILHSAAADSVSGGTEPIIPEDSSLSLAKYAELGVPEPSRPWTASEYEHALAVLARIPRTQLPRASGPSQLLFDRLVLSYNREFELPEGVDDGKDDRAPPDLPELYAPGKADSLLFDRELVAIRSETLSRTLRTMPSRTKLLIQARDLASMMKNTTSDAERQRFSEAMKKAEDAAEHVSHLVRTQTSELLLLASIPRVTDPARQLLLKRVQHLAPSLPAFLDAQDSRLLVILLKGSAGSRANASISAGLSEIAEKLENASGNT
jgi:hypothetical protein